MSITGWPAPVEYRSNCHLSSHFTYYVNLKISSDVCSHTYSGYCMYQVPITIRFL